MRSHEELPLKVVIEEFLRSFRLRDRMMEQRLIASWRSVTGDLINRHTTSLSIRKKVLMVRLDSAPLRQELLFSKQKLITELNKAVGSSVIDEIVFS